MLRLAPWLAYFDIFSIRGERILSDVRGPDRVALACDLYAYAHLPMITGVSSGRFVAALVLLVAFPLATTMPAIAALALVTVIWIALHLYELVWWREDRAESRSMLASS